MLSLARTNRRAIFWLLGIIVLTLPPRAVAQGPAITLVSIPPFGSTTAPLQGTVTGVTTANYLVAPLVFVESLGWYSKPNCAQVAVPIQPDGTWSVPPGGIDATASRIAAILVPQGPAIACYTGADSLPAALIAISVAQIVVNRPDPNAPAIQFAGYNWNTKSNSAAIFPGPCIYSNGPNNVFVDGSGALHLKITNVNGTWNCAEIYSKRPFGYGHYTFNVASPVGNLDPNVVFGCFTWSDDDASFAHREIDLEFSRFGNPNDVTNAQFAIQPSDLPNHLMRFVMPDIPNSINGFDWRPGQILFSSLNSSGGVISQWTAASGIPPQGDEAIRFNLWLFNGVAPAAGTEVVISGFQFVPYYADFDGDRKIDLAVWRPGIGGWFVLPSATGNPAAPIYQQWGLPGDVPVAGDFDGDGILDFAVWRPSNGTWYVIPSSNAAVPITQQWGLPGDVPVAGDFDGDGKTDFAVWRPLNGTWYIIPSGNPGKPIVQQWGLSGDMPLAGDFDSDGKTDFAVWRPSEGNWYIIPSANPTAPIVKQWGLTGDIPVAGDFDGDGQSDFAVWRPGNGTWYVIPSSNPGGPYTQQWGLPGDVPVVKDFDNDNKSDFAVWRPATGTWYILPSAAPGSFLQTQWGLPGDVPVYRPPGN